MNYNVFQNENLFLGIFTILILFCILFVITRNTFTFLNHPSLLFISYWFGATFMPILLFPDDYFNINIVLLIFIFCLVFYFGSLTTFNKDYHPINYHNKINIRLIEVLPRLIIISSCLGFSLVLITIFEAGYDISSFGSLEKLASMASDFAISRYSGSYREPKLWSILLPFVYLSPLLSGILYSNNRLNRNLLFLFVSLIPAFTFTLILTQRGITFFALFLLLSSVLATKVFLGKELVLNFNLIIRILSIIFIGIFILFFVSMLRVGATDFETMISLSGKVYSILFTHISNLSHWFNNASDYTLGFGLNNFAGISDILNIKPRQIGLYDEFNDFSFGETSNLYSIYRPTIEDFSLPGAILFFFFLGFTISIVYKKVQNGKISYIPILSIFYAYVLESIVTSITIFNTILLSYFMFYVIIKYYSK